MPNHYFQIQSVNATDDNQSLTISIQFNQSFQSTYGFLLFVDNTMFMNKNKFLILNSIHSSKPYTFPIGPYIL